jgi:hypothetical protein
MISRQYELVKKNRKDFLREEDICHPEEHPDAREARDVPSLLCEASRRPSGV